MGSALRRSPTAVSRVFPDAKGVRWVVYELGPPGERSLIFMSNDTVRRVRTYPTDWDRCTVAELEALSWAR